MRGAPTLKVSLLTEPALLGEFRGALGAAVLIAFISIATLPSLAYAVLAPSIFLLGPQTRRVPRPVMVAEPARDYASLGIL
jgi:hypothetical protein